MTNQQHDEYYKRQISQYATFEDRGVSLLSRMLSFAPTQEEVRFLTEQVADEKKHNRLFLNLAHELGVEEQFFNESLERLYEVGEECVAKKDWISCVACQSVIEELAIASFSIFFQVADEKARKVLLEVIEDEKKHLAFALNQLTKWVKTPEDKQKAVALQEKVLKLFVDALQNKNSGLTELETKRFKETLKSTYALHKQRFEKVQIPVPDLPGIMSIFS